MKAIHDEMKTWAEEQGIDMPNLVGFRFKMHHQGMGPMMKFEEKLD